MEQGVVPLAGEHVHEIHAARIGNLDGGDTAQKEGRKKGRDEGDASYAGVDIWFEPADLWGGDERVRGENGGGGTYTGDLRTGEALIGARAGEICKALWSANGSLEVSTVLCGGRVLPNGGILEGKGVGCEIGEGSGWVQGGEGRFGTIGPVDRAVLLQSEGDGESERGRERDAPGPHRRRRRLRRGRCRPVLRGREGDRWRRATWRLGTRPRRVAQGWRRWTFHSRNRCQSERQTRV